MRVQVVILLLLVAATAGCADGSKDKHAAPSSTSSTSSSISTSTSSAPKPNQAPTAGLLGAINGTSVSFNLTGVDPDGDALTWTLSFGDGNQTNGTMLPGNTTHAYASAGNYTANLTVSDGTSSTRAALNLTLNATVVASGAVQDLEADWSPADNPACADDSAPYDAIAGTYAEFSVDPATHGAAFTADFDSSAAQDHIMFLDAGGAILLHVTTGLPAFSWTAEGVVPVGAVTGVFFGCGGLPGEHVVYHAG